jgi:hypothetical protein
MKRLPIIILSTLLVLMVSVLIGSVLYPGTVQVASTEILTHLSRFRFLPLPIPLAATPIPRQVFPPSELTPPITVTFDFGKQGVIIFDLKQFQGMSVEELQNFDIFLRLCGTMHWDRELAETFGQKLLPRLFVPPGTQEK